MKHNIMIISPLALALMSGSAMAGINGGEVQFSGAVSNTTCDISLVAKGADSIVIDLGTAAINGKLTTPVNFVLQPSTPCSIAGAGSGVGAGAGAAQTQASISFSGPFDAAGLKPTSGAATDARVKLTAINSTVANTAITQSNNSAAFTLADLNKGATFSAALMGGATSGDYHSGVVYAVTYK